MTAACLGARAQPDPRIAEVLAGLREMPRRLAAKWFYDAAGSALFERITKLPEYYLTRTELEILDASLPAIASLVGPGAAVFEPGSGSGLKAERLLAALESPAAYTAIDVSPAALAAGTARIRAAFPGLAVRAVAQDFTGEALGGIRQEGSDRSLVFFPGSTIGNFEPDEATALLARLRQLAGEDGMLLLGADLVKDEAILLPAYDDAEGVTAEFNRNALRHLGREIGSDFVPERFLHRARFDAVRSRVEMHLESAVAQSVTLGGVVIDFRAGETLHTENCYKHSPARVVQLAAEGGWREVRTFTDPAGWFGVFLFEADRSEARGTAAR